MIIMMTMMIMMVLVMMILITMMLLMMMMIQNVYKDSCRTLCPGFCRTRVLCTGF